MSDPWDSGSPCSGDGDCAFGMAGAAPACSWSTTSRATAGVMTASVPMVLIPGDLVIDEEAVVAVPECG